MKKTSLLYVFALVALAFTLSNCSKSGDPAPATPAQKTALDSLNAALTGKWTFTSVAVMEVANGKSASTKDCSKSELASAGFSNTNWKLFTGEPNFTYSPKAQVVIDYPCLTGDPNDAAAFTITKVSSEVYTVKFNDIGTSNLMTFQIKTSDLKTSVIKATLISTGLVDMTGYAVVYHFTKS